MAREQLSLEEVLKNVKKKYGDTVVTTGVESLDFNGSLSFGTPSADFCIYNSFPEGRIIEFFGENGSGKTTSAFIVAGNYIKKEKERHPNNPRGIVLLDNEGTADPVWAKTLGYDMNDSVVKTHLIRPEGQSAEEVFDIALNLLSTGEIGLMIFDSIATLVPQQIADESMEKQQMGGIAKALTRFANTAIGMLRKYKATLIAINQVRENISGYGEHLITPGGQSWKHACSVRIMFKRGAFFDEDGNELAKKDANSPAGHIVELYIAKTKVCRSDRKLGSYHLNYIRGVDILQDTIDTAILLGLIDNSTQGSFKLIDIDTGEPLVDENGEPIKIRGKKNVKPYFEEHKDQWRKLYEEVYKQISKKDDPYIKSFEQMLGLNIYEKIGISDGANLEEI